MEFSVEFGDPVDDSCDIRSFSMGVAHAPVAGGAPSKAQPHDCHITMDQSALTAVLSRMCFTGDTIDSVEIYLSRDEDSPPFLTYVMSGVVVSSCTISGGTAPVTNIGLDFDSMKVVRG